MARKMTLSGVLTFIASAAGGCLGNVPSGYSVVPLAEKSDPLIPEKGFLPWRPPRQMAAFIHPHEDKVQGVMIGGHWIMVLLGEGAWYFEDQTDREPVPDAEAGPDEAQKGVSAITIPRDAVIPFRKKEAAKP